MSSHTLMWFDSPAGEWTEALPIGNGRLGAMCFGGTRSDRIAINEDSAWSGSPTSLEGSSALRATDGPEVLAEVRAALDVGDVPAAEQAVRRLQRGHTQAYQPVAELWIDDLTKSGTSADRQAEVSGYERWLDLRTAVAGHRWTTLGITHQQEVFASHPAQVIVVHRRISEPGTYLHLRLVGAHPHGRLTVADDVVLLAQRLPSEVVPGHEEAAEPVVYDPAPGASGTVVTGLRVRTDGTVRVADDGVRVSGATEVVLLVACETDIDTMSAVPSTLHGDVTALSTRVRDTLADAACRSVDALRAAHVADHQRLFDRVDLDLSPDPGAAVRSDSARPDRCPTDVRVRRHAERGGDPELAALAFAYGRYLLIAGSRPGTTPMNLQGIWNSSTRPPWSSNYTTNINLEMNYWAAHPANLPECAQPLHDWLARLAGQGARVARDLYGLDGWVVHQNSDVWGWAWPTGEGDGDPCWSAWQMGAAWLCLHLWEHWAFTADDAFLARVWPILRGAADFALAWLVPGRDGILTTSPSTSPENKYLLADGTPAALSVGTTADITLIRELFGRCLAAVNVLGLPEDDFRERLRAALDRLPGPWITADGRLAEWSADVADHDPLHRHQTHLIGVHPGTDVDVDARPELADAARHTLITKGPVSTGWSLAWRLNLHARLRDAVAADRCITAFLAPQPQGLDGAVVSERAFLYRNLFSAHPPFQIDGNLGFTAGVAELLVQSHRLRGSRPEIHLLPTLPPSWPSGRVRGLRARGAVTVDIAWRDGVLEHATLTADRDTAVVLRYGEDRAERHLTAGTPLRVGGSLDPLPTTPAEDR